jgi:hypothetical protein
MQIDRASGASKITGQADLAGDLELVFFWLRHGRAILDSIDLDLDLKSRFLRIFLSTLTSTITSTPTSTNSAQRLNIVSHSVRTHLLHFPFRLRRIMLLCPHVQSHGLVV